MNIFTKTSTAETSHASFVLILHEILIYSEWEQMKKGFLKRDLGKKFLSESRVVGKLT